MQASHNGFGIYVSYFTLVGKLPGSYSEWRQSINNIMTIIILKGERKWMMKKCRMSLLSYLTILALFSKYPPKFVEIHGNGGQTMGDTMDSKVRMGLAAFWYSSTRDGDGLISSTVRYPLVRSTSYTAGYTCLKSYGTAVLVNQDKTKLICKKCLNRSTTKQ